MKEKFKPLSGRDEAIAKKIVDAAYTVHKNLGPGLLEKVCEVCFCHELTKRGLQYQRQVNLPIVYDGMTFDEGLRWMFSLRTRSFVNSKLSINFNVPLIKKGIKRIIL